MAIDYSKDAKHVKWFDDVIPLQAPSQLTHEIYHAMIEKAYANEDYPFLEEEDGYLSHILDAKYKKMDIEEVMDAQSHLTQSQRDDLKRLLLKYPALFDGTLRKYKGRVFHINAKKDAEPVAKRPYPVPKLQYDVFKRELDHLVELGVLSPAGASEWQMPSFIIPKANGTVRWISDLRELNKVIKRKVYPLPMIKDVLTKRKGYKFFLQTRS